MVDAGLAVRVRLLEQVGDRAACWFTLGNMFPIIYPVSNMLWCHFHDFYPCTHRKMSSNSSIITKTTVLVFSSSEAAKLLQHHLTNSLIEPDADGMPFANPSGKLRFSSFVSLFPPTDKSFHALLFRLAEALFDDIDLKLGNSITVDVCHHLSNLHRKAALSVWLELPFHLTQSCKTVHPRLPPHSP